MTAKEREVFVGQWNRATGRIYPSNAVYRIAREVGDAYRHWHLGIETGCKTGLPAFKKRGNPPGIYMHNEGLRFDGSRVRLPRFGWMRWRGGSLPSGRLPGGKRRATRGLLSGRVGMDAGCWMLSCTFECGPLSEGSACYRRRRRGLGHQRPGNDLRLAWASHCRPFRGVATPRGEASQAAPEVSCAMQTEQQSTREGDA